MNNRIIINDPNLTMSKELLYINYISTYKTEKNVLYINVKIH